MRTALSPIVSILVILIIALLLTPSASPSLTEWNVVEANTLSNSSSVISLAVPGDISAPFASLSVLFIENTGQLDAGARFQMRGGDNILWLADDALWVTILKCSQADISQHQTSVASGRFDTRNRDALCKGVNVKLSFVGSNPHPRLEPFSRLDTHVSYFIGDDPADWRADVPVWGGVRYRELYPGIDLEITSENGQWVQRLAAHADADWGAVRLRVEGADQLTLDDGILRLTTAVGEYNLPLLHALCAASVPSASLAQPALANEQVLSPFALTGFTSQGSRSARLTQNPPRPDLLYSTFLGGASYDYGRAIAVDQIGNAYVTGQTASVDFPTTPGAFDTINNADAFVVKVNAAGASLEYATFLGGNNGADQGYGIAVDETGQAYLAGDTTSNDFPTTPGAYDTTYNGGGDAFVVRLNTSGTGLTYATYLGGSSNESTWGKTIAVNKTGNAYVTGETCSGDFPTTATFGPGGYCDAFVVKLDATGANLDYGALVGGSNYDVGFAIAVDGAGYAYLTGYTESLDFPATPGAFDPSGDGSDAFIVKVNAAGTGLVYSTFLGGNGDGNTDEGYAIAVDQSSNAYVTGYTCSSQFPTTPGAFDTNYADGCDAFVTQMNASGSSLAYSTFLGGSGSELGYGIAIDESGNAYVTGETRSDDFPITVNAFDTSYNGGSDAFVVRVNADGAKLAYATYLGVENNETGAAIAIDGIGNAYLTGQTYSAGFPATPGAFDEIYNGNGDAFVTELMAGLHIEIVQAIGRQYGEPRFVAGKDTAIRVFLPATVMVNPATQLVKVSNFGMPVATLRPQPSIQPTNTLTFLCPTRADCGYWQEGYYTFDVTIDGLTAQATALFEPGRTIRILAVPVKVKDRGVVKQLPDNQWQLADELLRQVYPVAYHSGVEWTLKKELDATGFDLTTENGQRWLLNELARQQSRHCYTLLRFLFPCYDRIIGFIPPMPFRVTDPCSGKCTHSVGFAYLDGSIGVMMVNGSFSDPDCPDDPFVELKALPAIVAHEVGHTYGLGDEYDHPAGAYRCDINPPPPEYGGREPDKGIDCQNPYHCTQSTEVPWAHAPLTQTGVMVLGERDHPFEVGGRGALGDMLSFMGTSGGPPQIYWVTPRVYNHLFDQLIPSWSWAATALEQPINMIAVSGGLGRDDRISLEPWYHLTVTATPPISATGAYTVEAVDALSQTLASQGFDVSFAPILDVQPQEADVARFDVAVAFPPGAAAFRIKHGDKILRVVPVSSNAPTITLTAAPAPGQMVSGVYTITWQSDDADGDLLYHHIEYCDKDQSCLVLATDITATQVIENFDELPGSQQARLKVMVSDGVNTAEATSSIFVVPPKPPLVFIFFPESGARYMAGMNVTLRGRANDPQDGNVPDTAMTWSSDRDGILGKGSLVNLHTLSVGTHTITLSATNNAGLIASTSVTITIEAFAGTPSP